MRTLLEHKADPNIRNNAGLSPLNLLGVPAKPNTSHQQALAKLLRAHGALDERPELAPQPDIIRIWRQGRLEGTEIFRRSTNWNNQFTLVETLLEAYSSTRTVFAPAPGPFRTPQAFPPRNVRLFRTVSDDGFDWPDLSRLTVRRLGPDGTYNHMEVNLLGQSNTVDLTKNLALEFGDVIEIPERSHALSDAPVGLTEDQVRQLSAGPPTKVVLEVGRQLTELSLPRGSQRYLRSMLYSDSGQKALRSTSDLGRILVHRRDPESKQSKEFLVNAYENREVYDDLLIENGDIIEVPDR